MIRSITALPILLILSCVSTEPKNSLASDDNISSLSPVDSKKVDCSKSKFTSEFRQSVMKAAITKEKPGTWTALDTETLKFEGSLTNESYDHFKEAMKQIKVLKKLILNSGGGETRTGIQIGLELAKVRPKVHVQGICGSSCANYLYTAGSEKIIEFGWVGFHGNHTVVTKSITKAAMREKWINAYKKAKVQVNDAKIDEDVEKSIAEVQKDVEPERRFLEVVGVRQELFDISFTDDKGSGLETNFTMLIPSAALQYKFGISNVVGADSQDLCFTSGIMHLVYY